MAIYGFFGMSSLEARSQNWTAKPKRLTDSPFSVGTWNCPEAILTSGQLMEGGTSALEAVVKGVAVEEANEDNTTVGIGASPDQSGRVTLDACVMDAKGNCGAVMAGLSIPYMCPVASEGTKGCGSHEGSLQSANPCWTPTCAHVHVHVHVHMHVRPCSYTFTCPCLVGRLDDGFSEASQACSPRSNRSMWHIRSAMHTRHEHGHEGLRLEPLRLDLSLHAIGLALNLQAMNSPMLSTAAPQAPLPRTGSKQIHLPGICQRSREVSRDWKSQAVDW